MTTLGQACGDLIEVFTELEDTLPESVYRDLEPVITKVRESAERAIVVEKQFELLYRLTKQLATNPRIRLSERAIAAIEEGGLDGIEVNVLNEVPEPPRQAAVRVNMNRILEPVRVRPRQDVRAPLRFDQFQDVINLQRDNHE